MDATWTGRRAGLLSRLLRRAADRAAERPAPPKSARQPVFIHDAIILYQGATLLLAVLADAEETASTDEKP